MVLGAIGYCSHRSELFPRKEFIFSMRTLLTSTTSPGICISFTLLYRPSVDRRSLRNRPSASASDVPQNRAHGARQHAVSSTQTKSSNTTKHACSGLMIETHFAAHCGRSHQQVSMLIERPARDYQNARSPWVWTRLYMQAPLRRRCPGC